MGSLKDQFLKAKLISKKASRQLEHKKRVKKKKLGKEGLRAEENEREAEVASRLAETRRRSKRRASQRQKEREQAEGRARMRDLVRNASLEGIRGTRRFFFVARDGKVPFFDISDQTGRRLESGQLAIVEDGSDFAVVTREVAEKIRSVDKKAVRFLNGRVMDDAPL